jgi:polysaccharide export outer membrane protein
LADPTKDLVGIAPSETEDIVAAAGAFLTEVLHRNEARQQHGRELIDLIALELRTLEDQASLQTEESEVQKNEIENARDLVDRGLLPRPRLTELLRVQSQLSQNRLANTAFAARARQAAETVRFEELNETMQNRETVRRNLSLARAQKSDIAAKISEIDLRILAAGGGAADARNITPRLIIFRKTNGTSVQIDDAGLDDTVQPGDVLELGIQIPDGPEIPTPKIPTIERPQGATSGRPNAAGITVGMGIKP